MEAWRDVRPSSLTAARPLVWYNFVKIHKTLKMTPAMASAVSAKLWSVGDIVDLIEAAEAPAPEMGDILVG